MTAPDAPASPSPETGPTSPPAARIIKKYANRRLYDTRVSRYITLDDLAAMVRAGEEFSVIDARTEADITSPTLMQIIAEDQARCDGALPPSFLRQLIALYGGAMPRDLAQRLTAPMEAAVAAMRAQQRQLADALATARPAASPIAELTRANLAMVATAASAFMPGLAARPAGEPEDAAARIAQLEAELAAAHARIASLEAGR